MKFHGGPLFLDWDDANANRVGSDGDMGPRITTARPSGPGIGEPGVSDLRVAQSRAAKYRDLAQPVNSSLRPAETPRRRSWRAWRNASKLTVVIERPDQ
jgi:hypothetical protein